MSTRRIASLTTLVGVLLGNPHPAPALYPSGPRQGDQIRERLSGAWCCAEVLGEGEYFLFRENVLCVRLEDSDEDSEVLQVEIDTVPRPMQIDLVSQDENDPSVLRGILRFDGGRISLCFADEPDDPRPTEFGNRDRPHELRLVRYFPERFPVGVRDPIPPE